MDLKTLTFAATLTIAGGANAAQNGGNDKVAVDKTIGRFARDIRATEYVEGSEMMSPDGTVFMATHKDGTKEIRTAIETQELGPVNVRSLENGNEKSVVINHKQGRFSLSYDPSTKYATKQYSYEDKEGHYASFKVDYKGKEYGFESDYYGTIQNIGTVIKLAEKAHNQKAKQAQESGKMMKYVDLAPKSSKNLQTTAAMFSNQASR